MTDRKKETKAIGDKLTKSFSFAGKRVTFEKVILSSEGVIVTADYPGWTETKHRLKLPKGGARIPSLDEMATFAGLDAVADVLPDAIAGFDAIHLTTFEVDDLDGDVALDLTWVDAKLTLIPGVLEVEEPGLRFDLDALPPQEFASLSLFGTVRFGGATLATAIGVPDLNVSATLTKPVSIADLAPALGIDGAVFGQIDIDRFKLSADPTYGHMSSSFVLDMTWEPAAGFALYRVDVHVDTLLGNTGGTSARIEADGVFAGMDLSLGGRFAGSSLGWSLFAEAAHDHPVKLGKILQEVAGEDVALPGFLKTLEISDLSVGYQTRSKNLNLGGTASVDISEGSSLDIVAEVTSTARPTGGFDHSYSGAISLADLHFELGFEESQGRTLMIASYSDPEGTKIGLRDIVGAVSDDLGNLIGEADPKITLRDALLVYAPGEKTGNLPSKYLFLLDVDFGLDLSGFGSLPLLGGAIPTDQMLQLSFQPLISSKDPANLADPGQTKEFSATELSAIRNALSDGNAVLPPTAQPGFTVLTTLQMGHYRRGVTLGDTGTVAPNGANSLAPGTAPKSAAAPATPDKVTWIDLHKKLGPISLGRIGLGLADGRCLVRLDAALAMGPLTLSLQGLGADYNLSTHDLEFALDGIGLSFEQETMSISGLFLKLDPGFAGMATLKMETLSIGAIGAYEEFHGDPSFFLYAFLDQPLGGPPFFFVEGLSLGFGYNRRLVAPPMDDIRGFPLVAEVMGDKAKAAEGGDGLRAEMGALKRYLPPEIDQYFLAVGIRFNSFKVLDGFALLTATFGNALEFDLMGEVTALIPPPPEPGQEPPSVLAKITIAYLAKYLPDEGFLGVTGKIAPGSFVFDPHCHLEGGFAFSSWFKGPHDGDFVFTMGGYHPDYNVPAHYPQPASVPRLSFRWEVDPHLSLHGDLYFALTSGAAMGGVGLHASWKSGALEAWFDLGIDVLIQWQPYHYTARAHVEIGARVTIDPPIIGSISVTIEAGAELELWGPEFSGRAHVHVSVMGVSVGFSVDFIETKEGEPEGISWEAFSKAFLPAKDAMCSMAVAGGLIRSNVIGEDGVSRDVINPVDLRIDTSSVVPLSGLSRDLDDVFPPSPVPRPRDIRTASPFGIAPMHAPEAQVTLSLEVTNRDGYNRTGDFWLVPILKRFPAALWGPDHSQKAMLSSDSLIAIGGYSITPSLPSAPGQSSRIERRHLDYDVSGHALIATSVPTQSVTTRAAAQKTKGEALGKALKDTSGQRDAALRALGFDPAKDLDLSLDLVDAMVDECRLVTVATS